MIPLARASGKKTVAPPGAEAILASTSEAVRTMRSVHLPCLSPSPLFPSHLTSTFTPQDASTIIVDVIDSPA
jgi:hypothetical protein